MMLTPFHKQQRGNTLTASRIRLGMEALGWQIDLYSMEDHQAMSRLKQVAVEGRYKLLHGLHAVYMGYILARVPELKHLPLLLTMTGTDLQSLRLRKEIDIIGSVVEQAAAIVVFNADFIRLLQDFYPAGANKIALIPQGVELRAGQPAARKTMGLLEKDFVFILPSGLRAIKNIEMAVDAIRIVHERQRHAKLLVVGAAIEMDYADRMISRFNVAEEIIYLGEVDHRHMKQLYLMADVVINCSHAEGQPQAALEAMSLGKPCILTAVPGNLNLIDADQEGIYVHDMEEMVAAMEFFMSRSLQRKAMGKAAARLIENRFTVQAELQAYQALYQTLLDS